MQSLVSAGDIETEAPREVDLDVQAVLNQYIRDEQEISDRARDLVAARGLPPREIGRMRRMIAEERKIRIDDDAIDYLLDQLVEILMHSENVEEVYAQDHELRLRMRAPLRRQMQEEESLDTEVRGRLKHVEEGTTLWEVEYRRMLAEVKQRRGL